MKLGDAGDARNPSAHIESEQAPRVLLPIKVWSKMLLWSRMAPEEISGIGAVEEIMDGDRVEAIRIKDLYLVKQECTPVETKIAPMDLAKFLRDKPEDISDESLRYWWHSHVDMGAGWSSQDRETSDLISHGCNFLSIVSNRRGDMCAKYNFHAPVAGYFDDLAVELTHYDSDIIQEAADEFKGKITNLPDDYEVDVDDGRLQLPTIKPEREEPWHKRMGREAGAFGGGRNDR